MKVTKVPLIKTGHFSGLTKVYLENKTELKDFYNHYFNLENFAQAIEERKKFDTNRDNLYTILKQQHSTFFSEFSYLESTIESIKDRNTFTITTGHQICLATGPIYFIYKIASAINLCRKLKKQFPALNFVPVYWMATEDHDFAEINHIHLFGKKVTWDTETSGATGRISTKGIETFLQEIKEIIGDKINDVVYAEIIFKAYNKYSNLADATRDMVLHLFANEGLLVIDADHKVLKNDFKEIIKKDIVEQLSYKMVTNSIEELVSKNLIKEEKIQVKPRAINFFYLQDNLRKRLSYEDGIYKVLDTSISFTEAQLLVEIDEFPERFSPNVIMRPIYQEYILPNLTYIGGAGELSYWFELKAAFDIHQVNFPMLALRNSLMWMDNKQVEKLDLLCLSLQEIFDTIEILTAKILKNIGVEDVNFNDEQILSNQLFEQIKSKISAIDVTLGNTAEAEKHKLLKSIEMLEQKTLKAQKNKHEISINQIKKIKDNLFPEGSLQERHENLLWFSLKFGNDFIKQVIEMAAPEQPDFLIVSEI
jgi:bacillithiol biosynthesis cysteine-adding enzyme BshC